MTTAEVETLGLKELLDYAGVAERLSISVPYAKILIHRGTIPSIHLGRRRLCHRLDVMEFAERLRGEGSAR